MSRLSDLLHFVLSWKIRKDSIVKSMPLEVSIEVTNVCNFKCAFCSQSNPAHFDSIGRTYLTIANTREILAKVREFGYDEVSADEVLHHVAGLFARGDAKHGPSEAA